MQYITKLAFSRDQIWTDFEQLETSQYRIEANLIVLSWVLWSIFGSLSSPILSCVITSAPFYVKNLANLSLNYWQAVLSFNKVFIPVIRGFIEISELQQWFEEEFTIRILLFNTERPGPGNAFNLHLLLLSNSKFWL